MNGHKNAWHGIGALDTSQKWTQKNTIDTVVTIGTDTFYQADSRVDLGDPGLHNVLRAL